MLYWNLNWEASQMESAAPFRKEEDSLKRYHRPLALLAAIVLLLSEILLPAGMRKRFGAWLPFAGSSVNDTH